MNSLRAEAGLRWPQSTAGALLMEQKLFWRNKGAALATFALPILLGIGLPVAAHQDNSTVDGIGKGTYLLTGMIGIVIVWGGLWQIVTALVSRRDELILKRLRATQLPESAILTGQILNSVLLVFAQVVVVAVGGGIVIGVPIPQNPLLVLAAVLLGIVVFVVLGVALTGWVPGAGVAPVMCVPFLLVSMFCSGVFLPLESLPSWLQGVAKALPLTPVVNGVRTGWFGRDFAHATVNAPVPVGFSPAFAAMGFGFAVLGAWLVAAGAVFKDNFRWEPRHS